MRCFASTEPLSLSRKEPLKSPLSKVALGFLLSVFMAPVLWAQNPTGSVRGIVKDQSNSVVSGARVTVVSKDTGTERHFTTKDDGQYQIGNLLAMLEPGVSVDATSAPGTSANNFFRVSIAGANQTQTRISVDGAAINDRITGGTSQNFSQEPVQEFQISTFNYDLATSVTSVGSINIVSRGGSNSLHGSTFFYYRDHNIAAFPGFGRDPRRFQDPELNDPFFARRQSGGSLGGPIKKDKLFWFFNFENNNQDGVFPITNNHAIYSQYDHVAPNPLDAKQANAKFDWKVNDKHNAFIRLSTLASVFDFSSCLQGSRACLIRL
jgi:carboxypeptidase family protein